ncbi:MAG: DNA polymerase III subunit alpha [Thermaerobacter sp.]|nr:DNA polymerase III subunit alpha [Thermaerobacter sp.]
MRGAHLHVHSAFSFLEGAALPGQMIEAAVTAGIDAVALTDSHRLSGVVPFLQAAEQTGIKAIVGAEVEVADAGRLVLLVPDSTAYAALTGLLTAAHLDSPRTKPRVTWERLQEFGPSLIALSGDRRGMLGSSWLAGDRQRVPELLAQLRRIFPQDHLYIELTASYLPGDQSLFRALADLGEHTGTPLVGTGAVHYASKEQFGLYDLMTCIRTGQPIESAGAERALNAENYLKPADAMRQAFRRWPIAWENALELGARLQTPDILHRHHPPLFAITDGTTAQEYLTRLVREGARHRYGARIKEVWSRIERELAVIGDMGFTDYFLVVWDVARYARERKIRYAGRGSAADSVVAYCLGITDVDAHARNLLFERFMSRERQEVPDIDIDFDARYRDAVADYVVARYGSAHVARVATYQTYRQRLAVREIGKVMGFPPGELDALAKSLPEAPIRDVLARWDNIPELRQYPQSDRLKLVLKWAQALEGLPRHLGTHVGGVVISSDPLGAVGVRERSAKGVEVIAVDKRDVEALGLLKLDLLSLRTFTAVDVASGAIRRQNPAFSYDDLPLEDAATYHRLQRGEGIGVFQLESPAQRSLAIRLQPDRWEDIVASLALIRPGPIKGNMVEPFIARRRGEEPVSYLHPDLEPVLSKTYGVVLFQEQVIAIASILAGFTPGEADQLRRVMTHARSPGEMTAIGEAFRAKAMARGVEQNVAQAVFQQIAGYASYGFNEAHAAAFAETAYRTAYLLEHHPREYLLGLLNAEPLGYYPIDVLLVEARRRGICVLPVDINTSHAEAIPEGDDGIRMGFQFVRGMGAEMAARVFRGRPPQGYRTPQDVGNMVNLSLGALRAFVEIGAFDAQDPDRDAWLDGLTRHNRLGIAGRSTGQAWSRMQQVAAEYRHLGFGVREQWMALWRPQLEQAGFRSIATIRAMPAGQVVRTVGILIRPHRPPTRSGQLVVFFSLLDETGILEARLSSAGYQKYGHHIFGPGRKRYGGDRVPRMVAISGRTEPQGVAVTALAPWVPL